MTIQTWYERRIEMIDKETKEILQQFAEDFYYYFKWKSEELYKLQVERSYLILRTVGGETREQAIKRLKHKLSFWTPESSTNQLSNIQANWDYEIMKRLLEQFQDESK